MHAASCAGITLDKSTLVDDFQLVLVGSDLHITMWDNRNNGKQRTCWLPALRTSTDVIVENIATEGNLNLVGCAVAMQLAAGEVGFAFCKAIINEGMKARCHSDENSGI